MKEFNFKLNGKEYKAGVEENGQSMTIVVNGRTYLVDLPENKACIANITSAVVSPDTAAEIKRPSLSGATAEHVSSPLPGTITEIKVSVGDKVQRGQVVIVMEAMKMANDIVAEHEGIVTEIMVNPGKTVNQGDVLVCLKGENASNDVSIPKQPSASKTSFNIATDQIVQAPLPGVIKQIKVKVGDKVQCGDVALTMEAMKMENNICVESSGHVKAVLVRPEQHVNQGDALVEIE